MITRFLNEMEENNIQYTEHNTKYNNILLTDR
jgi:hypothetical protein